MRKSRYRVVKRENEGKTWNITDELNGILLISTYSKKLGTRFVKMRRCDYEDTGRYPRLIPGYTLDKVLE